MSLVINTNIATLNARRNLGSSQLDLARSLNRLASGLRINSAVDDAAGLAISGRITTQINGRMQAIRNANDGISMLQTADGSLSTMVENLQRVRTLAVQSANASNSAGDRQVLQAEAALRLDEVDRLARTSSFNGSKIFSQDTTTVAGNENEKLVVEALKMGWLERAEELIRNNYGIEADGASIYIDITSFSDGAGGTLAQVAFSPGGPDGRATNIRLQIDMADFTPPNLPNGGSAPMYADRVIAHEMVHAIMGRSVNITSLGTTSMWFVEGAAEFIHGADERLAGDLYMAAGATQAEKAEDVLSVLSVGGWGGTSKDYSAGYVATRYLHQKLKDAGHAGGVKDFFAYLSGPGAPTMNDAMQHFFGTGAGNASYTEASFISEVKGTDGVNFLLGMNLSNADTGAIGGLDADGGQELTAEDVVGDIGSSYGEDVLAGFDETWENIGGGEPSKRQVTLQIGGEVGQTLNIEFGAMNLAALGLQDVSIHDQYSSQRAILRIDAALDYINAQRADIGSQLSRLDSTVSNLQVGVENAMASRSRVLDTDYAAETAALTRSQILQQASTAMVAQANALPRNVLSLLGR